MRNRALEIQLRLEIAELRKELSSLARDLERLPPGQAEKIRERISNIEAEIDRLDLE